MFSYFPSGVSNQRAADGNGYFLPVNWQTYTGNGSFSVQAEGALWAGPLADVLAFITTLIMLKLYWKKI